MSLFFEKQRIPSITTLSPNTKIIRQWIDLSALLFIVVLFFLLALKGLGVQDLDSDELITSSSLRFPLGEMVEERFAHGHPPLYFLLARIWVGLVGHSSKGLLTLSVLIGGLSVLAFHGLARVMGLGGWSLLAALLWALHPTVLFYARYARPMIGMMLLSCLILVITIQGLKRRSWRFYCAMLCVGLVGAGWNHLLALVWLSLAVGVTLLGSARRRTRIGFWLAIVGTLIAHAAIIHHVVDVADGTKPIDWIESPNWGNITNTFCETLGGAKVVPWESWFGSIVALLLVGALVWNLWYCFKMRRAAQANKPGDPILPSQTAWALIGFATLGPCLLLVVCTLTSHPVLIPRYLTGFFPGFLLAGVWLMSSIPWRWAGITIGFMLAMVLVSNNKVVAQRHINGLRCCIDELQTQTQGRANELVVVFNGMTREAIQLFAQKPFVVHIASGKKGPQRAIKELHDKVLDRPRVWILRYRSDSGLMLHPEWKNVMGQEFFILSHAQTRLYGYTHSSGPTQAADSQ